MSTHETPSIITLSQRQQILRRRIKEAHAKLLNRRPVALHDQYAHLVARSGDWTIVEQPSRELPLSLCQLISLQLRDQGNALFEETRALNNRFAGCSFRAVEVLLAHDPEFLDLRERALAWGVGVADQVTFKLRHQARDDPNRTFFHAYRSFISHIDTVIVHQGDRLHQMVWASVLDLWPYKLIEAFFLKPGHCKLVHEAVPSHPASMVLSERMKGLRDTQSLIPMLGLYSVEPIAYLDSVVLPPLLGALQQDGALPPRDERNASYRNMFDDLLEAHPYLLTSDRDERYLFRIPGTTCVATFSFLTTYGCANIMFWDDVDSMRRGLHSNSARGVLRMEYDGRISYWMHPWRSLDTIFGKESADLLAYWLLKQAHGLLVEDYLRIENYYLHPSDEQEDTAADASVDDETLLYVALAKTTEDEEDHAGATPPEIQRDAAIPAHGHLPQLRRRHFFKLLGRCGVSVEQGKGSEIKLLRDSKHPFRLGNHYGSNPTIPAFLAANILKRLEITRDEWLCALAAT